MKTLIILLAMAAAAHLYLRRNWTPATDKTAPARAKGPRGSAQPGRRVTAVHERVRNVRRDYKATSVSCGSGACAKARTIDSKRFLREEVPTLPLGACDAARCKCTYRHHEDRRNSDEDRRSLSGLGAELYTNANGERRTTMKGRGRRAADWMD